MEGKWKIKGPMEYKNLSCGYGCKNYEDYGIIPFPGCPKHDNTGLCTIRDLAEELINGAFPYITELCFRNKHGQKISVLFEVIAIDEKLVKEKLGTCGYEKAFDYFSLVNRSARDVTYQKPKQPKQPWWERLFKR